MSPRSKLQKARTHTSKGSSENDSPARRERSQPDIPRSPHAQETRQRRKSRDLRGRAKAVMSPKRQPLRELSPSERNSRPASPETFTEPAPPLLRMEMEREVRRAALDREEEEEDEEEAVFAGGRGRGPPSATYSKSPFPSQVSHILLPSPTISDFGLLTLPESSTDSRHDREMSVGTSDAAEYFEELVPEPLSAEAKRQSVNSVRSVTEDERSTLPPSARAPSALSSVSSMLRSTIRSIEPSGEFQPEDPIARSSASSETLSTRCHDERKSTGSNWTLHPPRSASTRPTSLCTRTPSPFGLPPTPRTPLFGPRSPGTSKRPVSTIGNPLSPYLEDEFPEHPLSDSESFSQPISTFGSRDKLLHDPRSSTTSPFPSSARKAYLATENPDCQHTEVRSVSGISSTDDEVASITVPKRAARGQGRQSGSSQQASSSSQSEALRRLPTIPSGSHSEPPTEVGDRNTASESLVSLPTMCIEGSLPPSRPRTGNENDSGEESSTMAAARAARAAAGIPPIRNPWQSVDSTSFFNLMMGNSDGSRPASSSRAESSVTTRPGSNASNATVVHIARGLPAWARSFYSTGDTSVIGSGSSRPSTRSKPSNSSLRQVSNATQGTGAGSNNSNSNHPGRRTPSSSRPTNTAPTDSPASSKFSVASICRPRNRPHSTIYSENWAPSPAPAQDNSDEEDTYSAGIEPHDPSTRGQPSGSHTHPLSVSQVPTRTDNSFANTQSNSTTRHNHNNGPLREFGPAGPNSHESPRLHRDRQSSLPRFLRPSSWIVGGGPDDGPTKGAGDRQIWLFVLGFVLPLAWMLGAVLPVPDVSASSAAATRPSTEDHTEKELERGAAGGGGGGVQQRPGGVVGGDGGTTASVDVEVGGVSAAEIAEQEKARARALWWRTLNRRMSVVGLAIVAVAVAVAVTLTR